ncbi:MAG TPA: hypothetical protein VGM92_15495 [Candidatus Kapabacteria bacterium]|jgi:hypothetical protein
MNGRDGILNELLAEEHAENKQDELEEIRRNNDAQFQAFMPTEKRKALTVRKDTRINKENNNVTNR